MKTKLFVLYVVLVLAVLLLARPARAAVLGDINSDGSVDIFDVVLAASQYKLAPAMPGYNSTVAGLADLAVPFDGVVDIFDLVTIISLYTG